MKWRNTLSAAFLFMATVQCAFCFGSYANPLAKLGDEELGPYMKRVLEIGTESWACNYLYDERQQKIIIEGVIAGNELCIKEFFGNVWPIPKECYPNLEKYALQKIAEFGPVQSGVGEEESAYDLPMRKSYYLEFLYFMYGQNKDAQKYVELAERMRDYALLYALYAREESELYAPELAEKIEEEHKGTSFYETAAQYMLDNDDFISFDGTHGEFIDFAYKKYSYPFFMKCFEFPSQSLFLSALGGAFDSKRNMHMSESRKKALLSAFREKFEADFYMAGNIIYGINCPKELGYIVLEKNAPEYSKYFFEMLERGAVQYNKDYCCAALIALTKADIFRSAHLDKAAGWFESEKTDSFGQLRKHKDVRDFCRDFKMFYPELQKVQDKYEAAIEKMLNEREVLSNWKGVTD